MEQSSHLYRSLAISAGVVALLAIALIWIPPIAQDQAYHVFADVREFYGVPNFWNVLSNTPFLVAALYGVWALFRGAFCEEWERVAFGCVIAGTAAVAIGSSYYHWRPNDQTLFWDRLPMTVVFMSIVATVVGERISMKAGKLLLFPMILAGAATVIYWRFSGDLRLYALVQFGSMLVLPVIFVLYPARYTGSGWMWWMGGLYVLAKILELMDHQIGTVMATGGHPWKHLAAAGRSSRTSTGSLDAGLPARDSSIVIPPSRPLFIRVLIRIVAEARRRDEVCVKRPTLRVSIAVSSWEHCRYWCSAVEKG